MSDQFIKSAFMTLLWLVCLGLVIAIGSYMLAPKHPVQYQLASGDRGSSLCIRVDIENADDTYIYLPAGTTLEQAVKTVDELNAQLQKYPIPK